MDPLIVIPLSSLIAVATIVLIKLFYLSQRYIELKIYSLEEQLRVYSDDD